MPEWWSKPNRRYRLLLVAVLIAVCVGIIAAAWAALLPFFLGAVLAYLLMPVVDFLERRAPDLLRRKNVARPLAIVLVYLFVIGLIAGALSYFIPVVISQARSLGKALPNYAERIEGLITYDIEPLLEKVPPEIGAAIDANLEKAVDTLADALQKGVSGTLRTLWQTVSFVIGMFVVPFWLYYVLNDRDKVQRGIYSLIPEPAQADVRCVQTIIDDLLGAYLRGQLILCFVVGMSATILLLALDIDLAILLGTVAGILEIVPVLGPYLGAVPAVLIALLDRPVKALWVAIGFFAIQEVEALFLVPRISGNAVRFHPAVVMVILVIGSEVAGVWGMLVAVPLAAAGRDVFRYLYLRTTERGVTPEMALENLRARML